MSVEMEPVGVSYSDSAIATFDSLDAAAFGLVVNNGVGGAGSAAQSVGSAVLLPRNDVPRGAVGVDADHALESEAGTEIKECVGVSHLEAPPDPDNAGAAADDEKNENGEEPCGQNLPLGGSPSPAAGVDVTVHDGRWRIEMQDRREAPSMGISELGDGVDMAKDVETQSSSNV